MYKLELAIADGGEVVIHAPHITGFSYTHREELAEVGYHVRDYFTGQWERFRHYPWTVLDHSAHLKGAGTCLRHNVGYRDGRESEDILLAAKAAEILYRPRH